MECRPGCGACCIAPSISSLNKPAGVRCDHLSDANLCMLFGTSARPDACSAFSASLDICGTDKQQAIRLITLLEEATS